MRKVIFPLLAVLAAGVVGCDTSTPNSPAQQTAIQDSAKLALQQMEAQAPSLQNDVNNAYGYVVFPEIGEAAIGIGGAGGTGVVYKGGNAVGTVKMSQLSAGIQLGGDTYGELIIFQDDDALERMIHNSVEFGADASATIIKDGAAGSAGFAHGVKIYVLPKGGLKAGVSLNGQKFHFDKFQQ